MKPFDALYYIKNNKKRSLVCIFMMALSVFMFLGGNYIYSNDYAFKGSENFCDKVVSVLGLSVDEDLKDFEDVKRKVENDDKLEYVLRTGRGFSNLKFKSVLGFEMTDNVFIFNNASDMIKVFERVGIKGDFSDCKNGSIILSSAMAAQKGFKKGDTVDKESDENLNGTYTVDAIYDSVAYASFIIYEDNQNLSRMYVYSDELEGKELYDYVSNLVGDKHVQISTRYKDEIKNEFFQFEVMFYAIVIFIAIVLAVTVNSVLTGHYLKRIYEFGVYAALGISKARLKRKVAIENIAMDIIAIISTFVIIELFSYLINELVYKDRGMYLVYYSKLGIVGAVVCNLLILIPVIILKGRLVKKADITEF